MTTETAVSDGLADDGRMFCYRHPTTETWLRCGRCDQPICVKCSIQGPVGSRCRQCGRVANDPLTSFTPRQLVLGAGAAVAGGAVGATASLLSQLLPSALISAGAACFGAYQRLH